MSNNKFEVGDRVTLKDYPSDGILGVVTFVDECRITVIWPDLPGVWHYMNDEETTLKIVRKTNMTPTRWEDMSREEKAEILVSHQEGEQIEVWVVENTWAGWCHANKPKWHDSVSYRVKPRVKTVELFAQFAEEAAYCSWVAGPAKMNSDTHKFVFEVEGDEPILNSVRMEKIK